MTITHVVLLIMLTVAATIALTIFFRYLRLCGHRLHGYVVILLAIAAAAGMSIMDVIFLLVPLDSYLGLAGSINVSMQILFYTFMIHFIIRMSVGDSRRSYIAMALLYVFPVAVIVMGMIPPLRHMAVASVTQDMEAGKYFIEFGPALNVWRHCNNAIAVLAVILAIRFELTLPKKSRNFHWVIIAALGLPMLGSILTLSPVLAEMLTVGVFAWMAPALMCYAFYGFLFTARPKALEGIHEMYMVFDMRGNCVDANQSARDFFTQHLGEPMPSYSQLEFIQLNFAAGAKLPDGNDRIGDVEQVLVFREETGDKYYRLESFQISNGLSRLCGDGFMLQDVTDWKRQMDELSALVDRDALTGAYNRRFLDEGMPQLISRAAKQKTPITVLMLDLDRFKNVNDTYGHPVGDEVLSIMSSICRESIRDNDIFCRYGGEEFLIVSDGVDKAVGKDMAERLCVAVRNTPFNTAAGTLRITVSIGGVTCHPTEETTAAELIDSADSNLYKAKNSGRDMVIFGELPPEN